MAQIKRLLVANRGEVVSRIARTARAMRIITVAVYTQDDAAAPYLRDADLAVSLGSESSSSPYLDADAMLRAALAADVDAIHPGYGFLSENAEFAARCVSAGLTWVGPPPECIRAMGSKVEAKSLARLADVPVLEDIEVGADLDETVSAAARLGFPLLVKPSAGGGGKGMHRVNTIEELRPALESAAREATSAFADGLLFIERYVESPRHVEVQVIGDAHGNVVHLGDRDCSVQRRHQKIIEESPAPNLDDGRREAMATAAVRLARQIGYESAGTVEFLAFAEGFAFLEMNTRLQVEHAVTEEVMDVDLVEMQLRIATGERLPFAQADVPVARGHAIEARIYAEDPANAFMPSPGVISHLRLPYGPGVRWESAVQSGSRVSSRYDPMIAKVIAHGHDRRNAVDRLSGAIHALELHGIQSNRDLLLAVLADGEFQAGAPATDYLARRPELLIHPANPALTAAHAVAAVLHAAAARRACATTQSFTSAGWRNVRAEDESASMIHGQERVAVTYREERDGTWWISVAETATSAVVFGAGATWIDLELDHVRRHCVVSRTDDGRTFVQSAEGITAFETASGVDYGDDLIASAALTAAVPGIVVAVSVKAGDAVDVDDTLVVLEAMKMEHRVRASGPGIVERVLVAVGDVVDYQQLLVELVDEHEE